MGLSVRGFILTFDDRILCTPCPCVCHGYIGCLPRTLHIAACVCRGCIVCHSLYIAVLCCHGRICQCRIEHNKIWSRRAHIGVKFSPGPCIPGICICSFRVGSSRFLHMVCTIVSTLRDDTCMGPWLLSRGCVAAWRGLCFLLGCDQALACVNAPLPEFQNSRI